MTDDEVLPYVRGRVASFEPTGPPERLPEGNLNVVWRVPGMPESLIVKYAPPYIAANPDMPLDPSRLLFEAQSLEAFAPEGGLADLSSDAVRPPRPIDMHTNPHVLLMEDVGNHPTLGRWLQADDQRKAANWVGEQLGRFIGRLHARTHRDEQMARRFNNRSMQETRLAVQYQSVEDMLRRGGVSDAEALGARAGALGERLVAPGICLTMGDLWPPSVLVAGDGLRVIDWELAHYGHPLQDVAHFAAHGWMLAHQAAHSDARAAAQELLEAFLQAYRTALGAAFDVLIPSSAKADFSVHFGAEILVRTVGPFQAGYLYEGLASDSPDVQEAVRVAAAHLREPAHVDTFALLH